MEKYIKYNISAKVSVRQFFSGTVNRKRLVGVFSGIVNAMLSAEEYMIDTGSILLDLDYIYTDVSTCETILICIPVVMEEEAEDLGKFFKNIVFGTKFDQTENCDYVAKIINYLNSMPVFSLLDFKDILDGLGREETDTKREIPMGKAKPQPTEPSYQKPQIEEAFGQPREAFGQKHSQQVPGEIAPESNMQTPQIRQPDISRQPAEEKKMSAMYLMMHYSKENKQKYKEQREEKKLKKGEKQKTASQQRARFQNLNPQMRSLWDLRFPESRSRFWRRTFRLRYGRKLWNHPR